MGRQLNFFALKPKIQNTRPLSYADSEVLTDEMLLEAQRAYFEYRNKIVVGDALQVLLLMASNSVDCFIFSPPYWNVRIYNVKGELGLESIFDCTPFILRKERADYCGECYTCKLVAVAKEIYRVLKPTGVWYLNIGDTFFGSGFGRIDDPKASETQLKNLGTIVGRDQLRENRARISKMKYYKEKSLCATPERLLIAIIDRAGFYFRGKPIAEMKTELGHDEEEGGEFRFEQRDIWEKCLSGSTPIYVKSNGRILRTTIKEITNQDISKLEIIGKNEQWRKIVRITKQDKSETLTIHLRNGTKIEVTAEHKFPIKGTLLQAKELSAGMKLEHDVFPDETGTPLGSYDNGYIIGLYLAEGSQCSDGSLQFSLHSGETYLSERLKKFACQYAGYWREHDYDSSKHVVISGDVPVAIVKTYVSGKNAKGKHLSKETFNENNIFLKGILDGFLIGDGSYDYKNDRWEIGITLNRELEFDLKAICNRLGYFIRSRLHNVKAFGKEYPSIRMEIREKRRGHFNQKDDYEIRAIHKTSGITYDIEVDGDHEFLLYDGTAVHNSNGFPSGIKDRYTLNYEMLYMLCKSKRYYFNREAIRTKLADSTIQRMQYTEYGFKSLKKGVSSRHTSHKAFKFESPFGKFGGHKHAGKNTNSAYSGQVYKPHDGRRNPGSIWRIATKTFPYEFCTNCDLLRGRKEVYHLCADCKQYVFPNRVKPRSLRPEQEMKSYTKRKAKFRKQEVNPECKICKKVTAHLIMCNFCKQECFSHYSMYPEELVRPLIKAAVPKQCCPKCGTPRFPIYKPSEEYAEKLGKGFHIHGKDSQAGMMQPKQIETANAEYELAGYTIPCWCPKNGEAWVPGIVADIYCGLGTVGAVAIQEGVDYFMSDLDNRNIRASARRLELAKYGKQLI